MPELDGYSTTQHLRELERRHSKNRVPIIALTAHSEVEEVSKCKASGMDDLVSKPIDKRKLFEAIAMQVK